MSPSSHARRRTLARAPFDGFPLTISNLQRHDADAEEQTLGLDLLPHIVELLLRRAIGSCRNFHEHALQLVEEIADCRLTGCRRGLSVKSIGREQLFGLCTLALDVNGVTAW